MKDIQQLIKKNSQGGRYEDIFPKTFIDAVEDRESGNNLTEILSGFNMYFLSYNGSREQTRLQVPMSIRKTGLWITYVLYDKTVVTEWYAGEAIDDDSWKNLSNWRVGSNMLVGDISISPDGYWVVNGVVTTTKAQGEQGITPMLRVGSNNHLQVSYTNGSSWVDASTSPVYTQFRIKNNKLEQSVDLGQTWAVVSDYIASWFRFTGTSGSSQADNVGKIQISRDNGVTWSDLSGEFTNSLHIKGYVATKATLPSSAVQGDIYGVGPTYDPSDTKQTNPIYQLYVKDSTGWVDNGRFTSIAAGVVQKLGNSETTVISQKTVTLNLIKREAAYNTSLLLSNNFIFKKGLVLNIKGVITEHSAGYFSTEAYFLIDNNILSTKIENLFGNTTATAAGICFYDESKTFIGYYNGNQAGYFDVVIQDIIEGFQDAVYFRICGFADAPIIVNSHIEIDKLDKVIHEDDKIAVCYTMLNVDGKEFYSPDGWDDQASCYLAKDTGVYKEGRGAVGYFFVTPFIPVYNVAKLQFNGATFTTCSFYVFYDRNRNIISQVNGDSNTVRETIINVPDDVYFVRFCGNIKYSFKVSIVDSIYKEYLNTILNSNIADNTELYNANRLINNLHISNNNCILKNDGNTYNHSSYTNYKVSEFINIDYLFNFKFIKLEAYRKAQANPMAFYDKNFKVIGTAYNPALVNTETFVDITLDAQLIAQYPNAKYVRIGINTKYDWSIISPILDRINITDNTEPYPSYKYNMFTNVICGGDSVTQGFVVEGTAEKQYIYRVMEDCAYPVHLKKIHPNLNIVTKALSGINSINWLSDFYPTIDFSQQDLFILELGLNGGLDINDINTDGTNTYAYKQIVAGARAQNPNLIIALVRSQHFGSTWEPVINTLSTKYDCVYIDLHNTQYLNLDDFIYHGYYQNGNTRDKDYAHFTRKGYNAKAYVISRLLADKLSDATKYN
jgi:lysophospholipase L1-like esterase